MVEKFTSIQVNFFLHLCRYKAFHIFRFPLFSVTLVNLSQQQVPLSTPRSTWPPNKVRLRSDSSSYTDIEIVAMNMWLTECRFDNVHTITILVDLDETKFMIHEDVITSSSKFFRAACSGGFKEAQEKVVRLPDIDVETFKLYAHWLYTGMVGPLAEPEVMAEDSFGRIRFERAAKLYIAGDVLDDLRLRNAATDSFVQVSELITFVPSPYVISLAYYTTLQDSKIRTLLVDEYLGLETPTHADWLKEVSDDLPKAFLVDLHCAKIKNPRIMKKAPYEQDQCRYHEHNDEVPKCTSSRAV